MSFSGGYGCQKLKQLRSEEAALGDQRASFRKNRNRSTKVVHLRIREIQEVTSDTPEEWYASSLAQWYAVGMKCKCVCTCGSQLERPPKIDRRKFWNEEKLLAAIGGMEKAGISLKIAAIEKDSSKRSRDVLFAAIGKRVYPLTVYSASRRKGFLWKNLCIKAGAKNGSRMKSCSEMWSSELTIKVIREMYMAGFQMNCKAVRFVNDQSRSELILNLTGNTANGAGLYKRAVTRFGDWKTALVNSGLKPENIRAKRKLTLKSKYAHLPVHMEVGIDGQGNGRTEEAFGFAPRTPEEILTGHDEIRAFGVALAELPDQDRTAAEQIIKLLLEDSEVDTLEQAVARISGPSNLTRDRLERIFRALRQSLQ